MREGNGVAMEISAVDVKETYGITRLGHLSRLFNLSSRRIPVAGSQNGIRAWKQNWPASSLVPILLAAALEPKRVAFRFSMSHLLDLVVLILQVPLFHSSTAVRKTQ
jgi:hypothetical protein